MTSRTPARLQPIIFTSSCRVHHRPSFRYKTFSIYFNTAKYQEGVTFVVSFVKLTVLEKISNTFLVSSKYNQILVWLGNVFGIHSYHSLRWI